LINHEAHGDGFFGTFKGLAFPSLRTEGGHQESHWNLIVASVGFNEFNATCRQRLIESLEVMDTELSWRTL